MVKDKDFQELKAHLLGVQGSSGILSRIESSLEESHRAFDQLHSDMVVLKAEVQSLKDDHSVKKNRTYHIVTELTIIVTGTVITATAAWVASHILRGGSL